MIAMTDNRNCSRWAVDVAGVGDYAMYLLRPLSWRLDRERTERRAKPQVIRNVSPISHIDRLERPLLVLKRHIRCERPVPESVWVIDGSSQREEKVNCSHT